MEFVIKIPKSLKEVKLNDFLQFSKLEGSDERLVMYKAFEVFTNLEKEHVKQLPYDVANQTLKAVLNLLEQKPQDRRTFFIGDVEYGRIPNMETITFGEYIELDTFITPLFHGEINSEYAFKFMSCLYRPIKEKVRDIYSIEPFTKEYLDSEHWRRFKKDCPADVYASSVAFFLSLRIELLEAMKVYFQQVETMEGQENNLQKIGDGMEALKRMQPVNISPLTKQLNILYKLHSTHLHTMQKQGV